METLAAGPATSASSATAKPVCASRAPTPANPALKPQPPASAAISSQSTNSFTTFHASPSAPLVMWLPTPTPTTCATPAMAAKLVKAPSTRVLRAKKAKFYLTSTKTV